MLLSIQPAHTKWLQMRALARIPFVFNVRNAISVRKADGRPQCMNTTLKRPIPLLTHVFMNNVAFHSTCTHEVAANALARKDSIRIQRSQCHFCAESGWQASVHEHHSQAPNSAAYARFHEQCCFPFNLHTRSGCKCVRSQGFHSYSTFAMPFLCGKRMAGLSA